MRTQTLNLWIVSVTSVGAATLAPAKGLLDITTKVGVVVMEGPMA